MKRTAGTFIILLAALSGCVSTDSGPGMNGGFGCGLDGGRVPNVAGVQGPWGQPVTMAAPYSYSNQPSGAEAARAMMARNVPMDLVQAGGLNTPGAPSGVVHAGGMPGEANMSPPGVPAMPYSPGGIPAPTTVAAVGALTGGAGTPQTKRTEVRFLGSEGMKVSWYAPSPGGGAGYSTNSITVPGRYNFLQGGIYRLKLSEIRNLPGVELFPTLEVVPSNLKTDAFLAHSAVPVTFTNEDFEQVAAGNYVVKVIYLPDACYQDVASTGPDEVVSSRLQPGVDPIAEAHHRGSILLVVRMGNIDLDLANSPSMDAPPRYGPMGPGHGVGPGMPGCFGMTPGAGMPPTQPMPQQMPPAGTGFQPLPPVQQQPAAMNVPVSQMPDTSVIQRTQYQQAAATAGRMAGDAPKTTGESDKNTNTPRRWWWPGS
jgi:hypothetical protein